MSSSRSDHRLHSSIESNNLDPDLGNSRPCSACMVPIFATPFIRGDGGAFLHRQCANLPEVLNDCDLHPEKPLHLGEQTPSTATTCSHCSQKCGTKFYLCPDPDCGLTLDVACALQLKITHRSHEHRLVTVRAGTKSLTCGICGDKHAAASTSYLCNICGFWIHWECATLPNVIKHEKHRHLLALFYDIQAAYGAKLSPAVYWAQAMNRQITQLFNLSENWEIYLCNMCMLPVGRRLGVYSCMECYGYILHVKCATSHPRRFNAVLSRKAELPSLVRLPIPDEHLSFVGYVRKAITRDGTIKDEEPNFVDSLKQVMSQDSGGLTSFLYNYVGKIEDKFTWFGDVKSEFILHHDDDDDDEDEDEEDDRRRYRVCDACVKVIDSPTYYNCSGCPKFFLHKYCYSLPYLLTAHPAHKGHILKLQHHHHHRRLVGKICHNCSCECTRLLYECMQCGDDFVLDVSCALMPGLITHEAHGGAAHFLHLSDVGSGGTRNLNEDAGRCHCCSKSLDELAYECRTCHNFALHTWCAMLPKTVTHKFDPHPLTLNTTKWGDSHVGVICEICENDMNDEVWCYSCDKCEQWFHVDCIPCLDMLYKIKSLVSVGKYDDAPKRLVRGLALHGRGHDYCGKVADEYDILASD